MEPEKPILFLDVDGVLNVYRRDTDSVETDGGPVWLPEGMAQRVQRLGDVFDVVWATAWRGQAHPVFRDLLGLPEYWPYLDWVNYKLPHILDMAAGRPWAFVDDDADWELEQLGWTRDRHLPDNCLVLNVDGLDDDAMGRLLHFADEMEPSDA